MDIVRSKLMLVTIGLKGLKGVLHSKIRTVHVAKTKIQKINHLFTCVTSFWDAIVISHDLKT